MTQASTPTGVGSSYTTGATTITVTWSGPITGGNNKFAIQFVSKTDSSVIEAAPGSPFTVAAPATGTAYSQTVTFAAAADAAKYSAYQVQVQALADAPDTPSDWGKQAWYEVGLTLTITIGSNTYTLTALPASGIYKLPVSAANPLTITYSDLSNFVNNDLNWGLSLPPSLPNNIPIPSALNISRFVVDTTNKTFAFDISLTANWTLFTGFTFNSVGFDIQRTNGTPLPM